MRFSDNGMSAVLLCSYIGIKQDDGLKPLSPKEWNELLDKAESLGRQPEIVLKQDQEFFREAGYGSEYVERIRKLTARGGNVAFELDNLERKGIQVVTPFDQDYPILLKRRLKKKTPPVLFYCGDITLAKKIGIGVVGSRNIDEDGIGFTQKLVEKAASERLIVYSGGAKGVDMISERTAIESGSAAVSFIADSLLSRIRKKEIVDSVLGGQRLLISDVKPDMGFTAARAMSRNKYIYASSYGTFVVASDYNTGGTWAGATEAMRNGWTKVLVWTGGRCEGNRKLIEKGAVPYELSETSVYEAITKKEEEFRQMDLFSFVGAGSGKKEAAGADPAMREEPKREEELAEKREAAEIPVEGSAGEDAVQEIGSGAGGGTGEDTAQEISRKTEADGVGEDAPQETGGTDLYQIAGPYIATHIGDGMTKDEAAEAFQVAKKQMETWLKRLCRDSKLKCVKGRYVKNER